MSLKYKFKADIIIAVLFLSLAIGLLSAYFHLDCNDLKSYKDPTMSCDTKKSVFAIIGLIFFTGGCAIFLTSPRIK